MSLFRPPFSQLKHVQTCLVDTLTTHEFIAFHFSRWTKIYEACVSNCLAMCCIVAVFFFYYTVALKVRKAQGHCKQ